LVTEAINSTIKAAYRNNPPKRRRSRKLSQLGSDELS